MSDLPDRPDLDQLRRQARELHRAAASGDARALRRLQPFSDRVTLAAAQLALAREYGFPNWPGLRAEVTRRRAAGTAAGQSAATGAQADRPASSGVAEPAAPPEAASQLIDGQYADRLQLRPILDAVLAALPMLGPVTVQARKTCVSLVSPRRTFAAVQATTKSRVDLGLRLDNAAPGGRLRTAKNIASGSINMRVALTRPDEVDEEAIGYLRRAYELSIAPPAPRRPARRPAPEIGPLTVVVEGYDLPGITCQPEPEGRAHRNVHVALTGPSTDRPALIMPDRKWLAIEPVPGDAPSARWEITVTVRRDEDGFDFGGPFVRGDRTDRHLGLAWGDVPGDGILQLFRGAKLRLVDVEPRLIEAAMRPGGRLTARVRLTDARGNPICARVRPPDITWSAGARP
jgi:hypothetical protein